MDFLLLSGLWIMGSEVVELFDSYISSCGLTRQGQVYSGIVGIKVAILGFCNSPSNGVEDDAFEV